MKWTPTLVYKYTKMLLMWTHGSFLGLFSVESYGLSCYCRIASPLSAYCRQCQNVILITGIAMFVSPDAVCCGARCSLVVALYMERTDQRKG